MNTLLPQVAGAGMGYWEWNLVRTIHQLSALHTVCDPNAAIAARLEKACSDVRFSGDYSVVLADPVARAIHQGHPELQTLNQSKS